MQKWLVQKFQGIAEYDDFWAPIIVAERELIGEGVALSSPPICYSTGKKRVTVLVLRSLQRIGHVLLLDSACR